MLCRANASSIPYRFYRYGIEETFARHSMGFLSEGTITPDDFSLSASKIHAARPTTEEMQRLVKTKQRVRKKNEGFVS